MTATITTAHTSRATAAVPASAAAPDPVPAQALGEAMNVLFLGGAKRVSMARKFLAAGAGCLFSYELEPTVPIAAVASVITGLRWRDPGVDTDLRRVIADCRISAVIPFVDGAVAVAARLRDAAFVPTGTPETAEEMFDKVRADALFRAAGLPVPASVGDRLIAKPRHGSASVGIRVLDPSQLSSLPQGEYLVQEYIARRREYTVDCYVRTTDGAVLGAVPRVRQEVVGGEVSRTATVSDPDVLRLAHDTLHALPGLRGAVTIQMLRDLDTGRLMLMEINPRLGGGAVCAVHAGLDLPGMIMAEAAGLRPRPCPCYRPVQMCRYMDEVIFNASAGGALLYPHKDS